MRLPWLDQYSNIGADQGIVSNLLKLDKLGSGSMNESELDLESLTKVSLSLKKNKSIVSVNYLE